MKTQLADDVRAVDVSTAEDALKTHYNLNDDIMAKDDEFAYVRDFGNRLLQKNPQAKDVKVCYVCH